MDDLISRQAAIDFIAAGHLCNPNEPRWSDNEVVNFLKSRPSAQRTGRWVEHRDYPGLAYLCSECNYFTTVKSYYCPYCGARMEEQE